MDIQCLFIGQKSNLYTDLLQLLGEFDVKLQLKLVRTEKKHIVFALKRIKESGLLFITDDIHITLEELSDLIWQYAPDAVVVILADNTRSSILKETVNNIRFSRLHFRKGSDKTRLFLQCLLQTVQFKMEFRRCKRLLATSEKKCLWLVESSHEAISYITRDLHLFANTPYLELFTINSLQKLRGVPVKELIGENEYPLFKKFFEDQLRRHDMNRSLVLSMKKKNGALFRANIHLIPSVYKGKKCLQLWVSELDKPSAKEANSRMGSSEQNSADSNLSMFGDNQNEHDIPNPFSVLKEGLQAETSKADSSTIILDIINRKKASLFAQKLTSMKKNELNHEHFLLSLKIEEKQKEGIRSLLFEPETVESLEQEAVFWDRVKFTKLFQVLSKKNIPDSILLVEVDIASIAEQAFTQWLFSEIARLGAQVTHLVFLLPSQLNKKQQELVFQFSKSLRSHRCKIAMDDYFISTGSLGVLKSIKPDYVRFSLEWIQQIEGGENRETALVDAISQFEEKNIKVITPCNFSSYMRKNFALAGVSFCQEKTT